MRAQDAEVRRFGNAFQKLNGRVLKRRALPMQTAFVSSCVFWLSSTSAAILDSERACERSNAVYVGSSLGFETRAVF